MAVRRDRPGVDLVGDSLNLTLPDGRTVAFPVKKQPSATDGVCCFCGERVEHSDQERTGLEVRWLAGDEQRHQSWEAHRGCLARLIHDRVKGAGPFFEEP
jgi:hypothetical protein